MLEISTWVLSAAIIVFIYAIAKLERAISYHTDASRRYNDAMRQYGKALDTYDAAWEKLHPMPPEVKEILSREQREYEQVEKEHEH